MQVKVQEILDFQVHRSIVNLYKRFLGILEEQREHHLQMMEKLENSIPENYHNLISNADYFTDNEFSYLRKKVLDIGNETVRELEANLNKIHEINR